MRFPDGNADNHVLELARSSGHPLVGALAFVGAISAASSMLIVDTLALAAMCLNHLVLPRTDLARSGDLYAGLLWARRALIVAVLALGYAFSRLLATRQGLVEIGLISFVAVVQVLPGVLALLFWRGATRAGFLAGLWAGIGIWGLTLFLPLLAHGHLLPAAFDLAWVFGIRPGTKPWSASTFWSLSLNALLFGGVSLLTRATAREEEAAVACTRGATPGPWMLEPSSAGSSRRASRRCSARTRRRPSSPRRWRTWTWCRGSGGRRSSAGCETGSSATSRDSWGRWWRAGWWTGASASTTASARR